MDSLLLGTFFTRCAAISTYQQIVFLSRKKKFGLKNFVFLVCETCSAPASRKCQCTIYRFTLLWNEVSCPVTNGAERSFYEFCVQNNIYYKNLSVLQLIKCLAYILKHSRSWFINYSHSYLWCLMKYWDIVLVPYFEMNNYSIIRIFQFMFINWASILLFIQQWVTSKRRTCVSNKCQKNGNFFKACD